MNPGRLTYHVEIQAPERQPDSQAGYVTRWVTIPHGTVWAEIRPMSGSRTFEALQMMHQVTHEITTWYVPGVTGNVRIKCDGRIFMVKSVFPEEDGEILKWMCEETTE